MFVRRLAAVVSVLPFLSIDVAIAAPQSAVSHSAIQVALTEEPCHIQGNLNGNWAQDIDTLFDNEAWGQIVLVLADCPIPTAADLDVILQRLDNQIRNGMSEAHQAIALQGVVILGDRFSNSSLDFAVTGFDTWLGALLQSITMQLNSQRTAASVKSAAAEVAGLLATRAMALDIDTAALNLREREGATPDLPALTEALLLLASDSATPNNVQLTALYSLRDIGYTLQAQSTSSPISGLIQPNLDAIPADSIVSAVTLLLQQQIDSDSSRVAISIRAAQVEVLSAYFRGDSESIAAALECDSESSIVLLNCIAADVEEFMPVRGAAVRALERLGSMDALRSSVANTLRTIALEEQDESINDESESLVQRTRQISAVETLSRIEGDLRQSPFERMTDPARSEESEESEEASGSSNLLSQEIEGNEFQLLELLASGLADSDSENDNDDITRDLQQRAEIAFDQRYQRNLRELSYAIERLYTVGYDDIRSNDLVQRTAVQALGAVNYRQLRVDSGNVAPFYLARLTSFLGQSLLCSPNADIRQEAAYALGNIAPYWPEMLDTPFERYWYNLSPARAHRPEPIDGICSTAPIPAALPQQDTLQSHRNQHKHIPQWNDLTTLDALILSLSDTEQNVVTGAASALGRYAPTLDRRHQLSSRRSEQLSAQLESLQTGGSMRDRQDIEREIEDTVAVINQTQDSLQNLKVCMTALLSPTRLSNWPQLWSEADDEMRDHFQPLVDSAEQYAEDCDRSLPTAGLAAWEDNEQAAIAAAFVLGRTGIGDGHPDVDPTEQETIIYLLRTLQARDAIANQELGKPSPVDSANGIPGSVPPYWDDRVRTSIATSVFGQINAREHNLLQSLVAAVQFHNLDDSTTLETSIIDSLSCEEFDEQTAHPGESISLTQICIEAPSTRLAILRAIELIGIEYLDELDSTTALPNEPDELLQLRQNAQQIQTEIYVQQLRRLLTQDKDPELTQAAATDVMAEITALIPDFDSRQAEMPSGNAADSSTPPLTTTEFRQDTPDTILVPDIIAPLPVAETSVELPQNLAFNTASTFSVDSETVLPIQAPLGEARYVLAFPLTSLYSCAGAAFAQAELGVYDKVAVDQLLHYLFAYPEPLQFPNEIDSRHSGNLCMPGTDNETAQNDELPSRYQQILQLKTGAIAALGAIRLPDSDPISLVRQNRAVGESEIESVLADPATIKQIVETLGEIAALDQELVSTAIPPILSTAIGRESDSELTTQESSPTNRNLISVVDAAQLEALGLTSQNVAAINQLGLPLRQGARALRLGLTRSDIDLQRAYNLTLFETAQVRHFGIPETDFAAAQNPGATIAQLVRQEYADGMTPREIEQQILSQALSESESPQPSVLNRSTVNTANEICALSDEDRNQFFVEANNPLNGEKGSNTPTFTAAELAQCEEWGLTAPEFFVLKRELQAAAIAALGAIARTQLMNPGRIEANRKALEAVGFDHSSDTEQIRELKLEQFRQTTLAFEDAYQRTNDEQYSNLISYVLDEHLISQITAELDDDLENESNEERQLRSEFREATFNLVIGLNVETIRALSPQTRQSLYVDVVDLAALTDNSLAQECLSSSADEIFNQERVCFGVARVLSAMWGVDGTELTLEQEEESIAFLEALAGNFAPGDSSQNTRFSSPELVAQNADKQNTDGFADRTAPNTTRADIQVVQPTPIIRSSGVEALSQVAMVGTSSHNTRLLEFLFHQWLTVNDPRILNSVVQTFVESDPTTTDTLGYLTNQLSKEPKAAANLIARIGQAVEAERLLSQESGTNQLNLANPNWTSALSQPGLIDALVTAINSGQQSGNSTVGLIDALGETRTDDASAIATLTTVLNNGNSLGEQEAAAYALGKIGERHPNVGQPLANDLYNLVKHTDTAPELRVAAAYAVSQINIYDIGLRENLTRHAITYELISLFAYFAGIDDVTLRPEDKAAACRAITNADDAHSAIALKALSQLDSPSEEIAAVFACALTANDVEIRAIAATYAGDLSLWNSTLADAMFAALDDPHWSVRYGTVQSISNALNHPDTIVLESIESNYSDDFRNKLQEVFWNEREDDRVRLVAGNALLKLDPTIYDDELSSSDIAFSDTYIELNQRVTALYIAPGYTNPALSRLNTSSSILLVLDDERGLIDKVIETIRSRLDRL